jgi:Flp pilus assembly protein CpaB
MRKWLVPIVLGVVTCLLLVAVLWQPEEPKLKVVVAATNLGAGVGLAPSDLATVAMTKEQAPADALTEPGKLVGQTLAVVRFAGEPITLRHLGPAVDLKPDERGVAVRVKADTGLAGLLRPGMTVGVVANLRVAPAQEAGQADSGSRLQGNTLYSKLLLEGLRVVYVSPDFQARPNVPVTLQATVSRSGTTAGGALFGGSNAPAAAATTSDPGAAPKEGVIVLAASTVPQQLLWVPPNDEAMAVFGGVPLTASLPVTQTGKTAAKGPAPKIEPILRWTVPVELLTALNGSDALALVLMPQAAQEAGTPGLLTSDLLVETSGGGQ